MAPEQSESPEPSNKPLPESAGWTALNYLMTGLLLGFGVGWLLAKATGLQWTMVLGLLGGLALSMYMIWLRYVRQ